MTTWLEVANDTNANHPYRVPIYNGGHEYSTGIILRTGWDPARDHHHFAIRNEAGDVIRRAIVPGNMMYREVDTSLFTPPEPTIPVQWLTTEQNELNGLRNTAQTRAIDILQENDGPDPRLERVSLDEIFGDPERNAWKRLRQEVHD